MKKLLLVLSSVRESRAADTVLAQVQTELQKYPDFEVGVADFTALPLPLIDTAVLPSSDDFVPEDTNVQQWTKMVAEADVVLFLVAEYNHSYTAPLKNAIDWVYQPWIDKPVAFIGYGWAGGQRAIKHLRDVLQSNLATKPLETEANLRFMKELNTDGTVLDETTTKAAINDVLTALK